MDHQAAAHLLLAARATSTQAALPPHLQPATHADAYAIQRLTLEALGPIGGWKIGAAGPAAPPECAPMPAAGMHYAPATGPAELPGDAFTTRDIESEIAFVLARDLPPRATPYTPADIEAAIASCHPGIEIVQTRLADPDAASPLTHLADLARHGAYLLGPPIPNWQTLRFPTLQVRQSINSAGLVRTGNPAGDMIRLLTWLANEGAAWAGGPRAGQILTCGSWTGKTPAPRHATIEAAFAGAPALRLRFV